MTNYSDGDWHEWHGGDCPVHPLSDVEVRFFRRAGIPQTRPAYQWVWSHDDTPGDIMIFRTVTEYIEGNPQ